MPAPRALHLRDRRGDDVPEVELSLARLGDRAVSAVFLDRDGTLNVKAPEGEYVTDPAELVLLPGAGAAVARLNRAGVRTVLVTNQRWLSEPGAPTHCYAAVHARLVDLLAAHGARLDAAFHCPHARGECECRKPAPGLLYRAAHRLDLDLPGAVIVGDSASDVAAGAAAGTGTILITSAPGADPRADATVVDLREAVDLLLGAPDGRARTSGATWLRPPGPPG